MSILGNLKLALDAAGCNGGETLTADRIDRAIEIPLVRENAAVGSNGSSPDRSAPSNLIAIIHSFFGFKTVCRPLVLAESRPTGMNFGGTLSVREQEGQLQCHLAGWMRIAGVRVVNARESYGHSGEWRRFEKSAGTARRARQSNL